MFTLFPRPMDRHFIDGGRVPCPARECDVESDICAGCRWMIDMDEKAKLPYVRCRPVLSPILFR